MVSSDCTSERAEFIIVTGHLADESFQTIDCTGKTRSSSTAEIVCDADETAIQGHLRSSVVVPIDVTYMTFY